MKKRSLMNMSLGLNNNADPATFSPDRLGRVFLSGCNNIVIGDTGRVERCLGKSIHEGIAGAHSLYSVSGSLYAWVHNGSLRMSNNQSTGLSHNGRMSYARLDDRVFFSNGTETGYIREGEFHFSEKGIYSGPDTPRDFSGPVPGHLLCYALGCLLVGRDNTIWMSEPRNPFLFPLADARFTYNSRIRMIAGLEDGFWVSDSDAVYWVSFRDGRWQQSMKALYPAFEGEPSRVNLTELPLDNIYGTGWLCPTAKGICLLGPGGIFLNLTEKNLELRKPDGLPLPLDSFAGIVNRNRYYCSMWGQSKVGLILNLNTLAVTQHDLYLFNSACRSDNRCYGAYADGIYTLFELWPRVDSEFSFYTDIGRVCRMRFLHIHGEFSGDIQVKLTCDESVTREYTARVRKDGNQQHEFKIPVVRDNGIGTYWKTEISNINGRHFAINRVTADVIYRR